MYVGSFIIYLNKVIEISNVSGRFMHILYFIDIYSLSKSINKAIYIQFFRYMQKLILPI